MPETNPPEEYPDQLYGWVKENDGTWSLYSQDGTKLVASVGGRVQVSTPVGGSDVATKAYADAHGGLPSSGWSPPGDVLTVQADGSIAAAAGGGGSSALKSWLSTSLASFANMTDGTATDAVFDFPADGSTGSDITLSSDGITFTLVNDGFYTILSEYAFGPNADSPDGSVMFGPNWTTFTATDPYQIDSSSNNGWPLQVFAPSISAGTSTLAEVYPLSVPLMFFTGGSKFKITGQRLSPTIGTIVVNSIRVLVCRVF